jgi:sigma-E factor negative regulatory protein RseA
MTEQIQNQVSAFLDDELSAEECAFLVRRLERDPDARSKFFRYTTIGAALRGELLEPDPAALRRGVEDALTGTATKRAPQPARPRVTRRFARPALGVSIAAGVALAGVWVLRASNEAVVGGADAPAIASPAQTNAWNEPQSYVVPQDSTNGQAVLQPIRLTNYVVRHGQYARGLGRTSIHSNVVGAQEANMETEQQPQQDAGPEPWE